MNRSEWLNVPDGQRLIMELCFRLGSDFVWRGVSELLVAQPGAERVLEALDGKGVAVLGLEGFNIDAEGLHPRLDLIYDADRAPSSWSPAPLAGQWPPDVWIEIVLGGLP